MGTHNHINKKKSVQGYVKDVIAFIMDFRLLHRNITKHEDFRAGRKHWIVYSKNFYQPGLLPNSFFKYCSKYYIWLNMVLAKNNVRIFFILNTHVFNATLGDVKKLKRCEISIIQGLVNALNLFPLGLQSGK